MENKPRYEAVIFDLDGTLLDTTEGVLNAVDYTIQELNLPKIDEDMRTTFIGPPIQNSLRTVFNLDAEQAKVGADLFRNIYKSKYLYDAQVYPYLIEVLSQLRIKGIHVGVATYKREDYTLQLLNHFGISEYCDTIHGSDFDGKLQKSDIIELCLKDLKIKDYSKVLMVGDTIHDALGAEKLGIPFIGVTYGFGFKDPNEHNQYKVQCFINEVKELLNIV